MSAPETEASSGPRLWLRRALWLVAIWAMSVAALGVVALLLRLVMTAAGLRTH
ncbi:DUF2474 domain-containing protein [Methylocella sp.]|uniref:DUF2474 domain-containing protein n=1 Tax=Methylocella sp. TaxID=1978226 RepID=UPI0037843F83